jgi:hypothetical protein
MASTIEQVQHHEDPLTISLYAVKAPESKRQYPRRFKMFLYYLNLKGTIIEQADQFLMQAKANPQSAQDNLMQFIVYQNQRVSRGEIFTSLFLIIIELQNSSVK